MVQQQQTQTQATQIHQNNNKSMKILYKDKQALFKCRLVVAVLAVLSNNKRPTQPLL
jgi:hypothetical protein